MKTTVKTSRKNLLTHTALATAIALTGFSANAALYDRGNGMIYDSTQNITWLQDANYAKTSGYDGISSNGTMSWTQSNFWADNLIYGGFSDWRLPSAGLNGTGYPCSICPEYYNGTNDLSYNNTRSEIGHLFLELGNIPYYNPAGVAQDGSGVSIATFVDASTGQTVSFLNLQNAYYWESETTAWDPYSAWLFDTSTGAQSNSYKGYSYFITAWAVRDGDVLQANEVPVPAAAWLFGTCLIGLAGLKRRNR